MKIEIKAIRPNPKQPRKDFDPDALMGLAESIKEHGLIQPIIVEEAKGGYVLVSGERRLRAHKLLGLKSIEAVIRGNTNHNGRELLTSAIVENLQREDMNPIEMAQAYAGLRDDYGMKPEEIARKIGKAPTQIYTSLRLLEAEPEIQRMWAQHTVTHDARTVDAVLSVPAGEKRVELMKELERRKATGKMIIAACARFNALQKPREKGATPAGTQLKEILKKRPEWDALYQVGKVPPWPVMNEAVTETCDRCALRPQASEAVCDTCPMVALLKELLERIDGS